MKTYKTGKHTWNHGEVVSWVMTYRREPSRWLLGTCPHCGMITSNYGGAYSCHDDYCRNSANIFACSPEPTPKWWNTDVNVELDGDSWCATRDGFVNLQESIAGFGKTPNKAVENLEELEKYENL